ncbi:MAG: carboxypeptidase regulatory-like domain-containing protein [bacterium]
MRWILKLLGLFVILAIFTTGLDGCSGCNPPTPSGSGSISGTVRDSGNNNPLSGVTVSISGTNLSATTDSNGNYQIPNVPAGTKTVTASKSGYNPQSRQVNIPSGGTVTVDFSLVSLGHIVFQSYRDGNWEIYKMNGDGTDLVRLTSNTSSDQYPFLSADGTKIVFVSARDGNNEVYIMNADGTGAQRLTNSSVNEFYPALSPRGDKIVFERGSNIWIMDSNGGSEQQLTNTGKDTYPSFSPDGSKILFGSYRDSNNNYEIYIMDIDGSNQTRLTDSHSAPDQCPRFSPNGSKIVFHSARGGYYNIWIMDSDGSNLTKLTDTSVYDGYPCFSYEGGKIAFESGNTGSREIYIMNVDGTNPINITNSLYDDRYPSWGL